jgi:Carbohydrate family 9 binding domain-like
MKELKMLLLSVLLTFSLTAQKNNSSFTNEKLFEAGSDPGVAFIRKCEDFKITGNGGSDAWIKTEWIKLVPQGSNNIDYETKVKVLYSGTGIYFLFSCRDEKLTTSMKADNLNLWEEDVVEVFLWTSEDFPVYFEYEISPMDYELPIMVPNYKGKFLGWLPWKYDSDRKIVHATSSIGGEKISGGKVSEWIAEFFIPFKLLNPLPQVPPSSGTKWRANMYRIDYDKGSSHYSWQRTTGSFHDYKNFGTFVFE